MPEIALPTAEKQNIIYNKINDAVYNTEIYNNIITASFDANTTTHYQTLLEVNGTGELLELVLCAPASNINNCGIKITIDDEVIYSKETTRHLALFLLEKNLLTIPESTSNTFLRTYSSISKIAMSLTVSGVTNGNERTVLLMQQPIKFKQNLKVEAFNSQASGIYYTLYSAEIGDNRILYRLT